MINNINFKPWIEETFKKLGFKQLTVIQQKTIPLILKKENVIAISSTGSGKTLSYVLPILQNLELNNQLQVLIISPTRELARQIYQVIQQFKKQQTQLKTQLIIGGIEIEKQINYLKKQQPQIMIATISRLKELVKLNIINLGYLNTIVFDEMDMIIDLGFLKDIDYLLNHLKQENIQKLAFSATLHELLAQNIKKYFNEAKIIKVGKSIYENNNINHHIIHTHNKDEALEIFTKTINPYLCIIFCNKNKEIKELMQKLENLNIKAIAIHGDLNSRDRKNAYKQIKSLDYQYVVASDLASRGLDIDGASHIINWDLPEDLEWYVHRCGRCGRGKYHGDAYLFFDGTQEKKLQQLEKKKIKFDHLFIKNHQFVTRSYTWKNLKPKVNEQTKQAINEIKIKPQKVKPNYKKKQQQEIKKIKQKAKRKHLEQKIKQQRIETYKQKNRNKNKAQF